MKRWSHDIDPATIPDDVLASERGRRNNSKIQNRAGGGVWSKHNPEVSYCRCVKCNERREKENR